MNHEVEVESSSKDAFDLAMQLAFLTHREATHFLIDKESGCLVVFWHDPSEDWKGAQKLRKPMDWRDVADYAWEWVTRELRGQERPKMPEPVAGAFHLKAGGEFRLSWRKGHGPESGSPYGIVAVWPTWNEIIQ
jgi:hypothetical protein